MAGGFACRLCHHSLLDEVGCAFCLPLKENLVPLDVVDEDAVPLSQLAQETQALLRRQLLQLKGLQKSSGAYDPSLAKESREIANALAKLLDSSRKVLQDGADAVENMSFQEKANLMLEFFSSLPPAYRRQLYERMAHLVSGTPQYEAAQADVEPSSN